MAIGFGHGVGYYYVAVTVLYRAMKNIRLVSSTLTVTCRFGLSAKYGYLKVKS